MSDQRTALDESTLCMAALGPAEALFLLLAPALYILTMSPFV